MSSASSETAPEDFSTVPGGELQDLLARAAEERGQEEPPEDQSDEPEDVEDTVIFAGNMPNQDTAPSLEELARAVGSHKGALTRHAQTLNSAVEKLRTRPSAAAKKAAEDAFEAVKRAHRRLENTLGTLAGSDPDAARRTQFQDGLEEAADTF